MPTLDEIIADERELQITDFDVPFTVWYRPSAVTMPMLIRAGKMQRMEEDEALGEIADLFCAFIVGWDITGRDGKPLPIDEETVNILPVRMVGAIFQAVTSDIEPEEEEKKASNGNLGAGLSRKERRANARTGSPSSKRQSSME